MTDTNSIETIRWDGGVDGYLVLVDQTRLPTQTVYRECRDVETADRVVRRLEGVVIARDYSLLEYNVPREKLAEAEAITPGFESPTVNTLEDQSWCSVSVMVRRGDVIAVMEKLEALGASAIFEMKIANCRL